MPIALDISSTNGSQFFFWLIEASVEMTPKTILLGVFATATPRLLSNPTAASPTNLNRDRIMALLVLTGKIKRAPGAGARPFGARRRRTPAGCTGQACPGGPPR